MTLGNTEALLRPAKFYIGARDFGQQRHQHGAPVFFSRADIRAQGPLGPMQTTEQVNLPACVQAHLVEVPFLSKAQRRPTGLSLLSVRVDSSSRKSDDSEVVVRLLRLRVYDVDEPRRGQRGARLTSRAARASRTRAVASRMSRFWPIPRSISAWRAES